MLVRFARKRSANAAAGTQLTWVAENVHVAIRMQAHSFIEVPTRSHDVTLRRRVAGGFLVVVGIAFGLLWLMQLVPAAVCW